MCSTGARRSTWDNQTATLVHYGDSSKCPVGSEGLDCSISIADIMEILQSCIALSHQYISMVSELIQLIEAE